MDNKERFLSGEHFRLDGNWLYYHPDTPCICLVATESYYCNCDKIGSNNVLLVGFYLECHTEKVLYFSEIRFRKEIQDELKKRYEAKYGK